MAACVALPRRVGPALSSPRLRHKQALVCCSQRQNAAHPMQKAAAGLAGVLVAGQLLLAGPASAAFVNDIKPLKGVWRENVEGMAKKAQSGAKGTADTLGGAASSAREKLEEGATKAKCKLEGAVREAECTGKSAVEGPENALGLGGAADEVKGRLQEGAEAAKESVQKASESVFGRDK